MQSNSVFIKPLKLSRREKRVPDVEGQHLLNHKDDVNGSFKLLVKQDDSLCYAEASAIGKLRKMYHSLCDQFLLPDIIAKKPGVLHCTDNTAPVWGRTPLIVTIRDINFLESGIPAKKNSSLSRRIGAYYRKLVIPLIVKRAAHVITASESHRQIILRELNIEAKKVSVIYNGADERFFVKARYSAVKEVIRKYGIGFPYIFTIGGTEREKNTDGVIKSFALFCRKHPEHRHKLVVKGLTKEQLLEKVQESGAEDVAWRIHTVAIIDLVDLPLMYQGADVLWFPSLSADSALPVIEAMAGGTPVVTSDVSPVVEIAVDSALYADPRDASQLVKQTILLFTNNELKNDLVAKGKERASQFTRSKSAKQLLELYETVLLRDKINEISFADKLGVTSPLLTNKVC